VPKTEIRAEVVVDDDSVVPNAPPEGHPLYGAMPEEPTRGDLVIVATPTEEDMWTFGVSKKVKKKLVLSAIQMAPIQEPKLAELADFRLLHLPLRAPRNNHERACRTDGSFIRNHSYSRVLLCHASLWALADYRLINSLKALALYKLHKTLCIFELDDKNVVDIIDLARFAYSEEGGGGAKGGLVEGGTTTLRGLVCHYIAQNAVVLSVNSGFMELVGEGGDVVKDFFSMVVRRIN
jgi:hypothetical protein